MDAMKMATFTGIVGIEYHLQEQLVHSKASITTEDDIHTPDAPETDTMTEEAVADLILDFTQEIEVRAAQDAPAQTDTSAGTETRMKAHV